MATTRSFASDNNAPIHPLVLEAIGEANTGHARAYGDDRWTRAMEAQFREHFGSDARAWCVFGGTGANVLGLQALTRPHHSVLCAEGAHIDVDECGAPERFTGCKLIPIRTPDGKLTPELVVPHIHHIGDQHHVQAKVIAITQATEVGTVYQPREISALAELARKHSLYLHMDGARIANAAAALNLPLRAITTEVGVDVLSFGGTKNGLMGAEAVVVLNPAIGAEFLFQRKQAMQLASKMRFVSCQIARTLEEDLWRECAAHANAMAQRLGAAAITVPGVTLAWPVQANGVFAAVPRAWIPKLQEQFLFYVWDEPRSIVRWMCSFDTTAEDVDGLVRALRAAAGGK